MSLNIVTQLVSHCNLDCSYCYEGKKEKGLMTEETLELLFSRVDEYGENIHFTWLGGETLLAPKNYFELISSKSSSCMDKKITNSIQTNGTLLSDNKYLFLENLGFKIGISFDPGLGKDYRISKSGVPQSKYVEDIIRSLSKKPAIITVLANQYFGLEKELYFKLKENSKSVALNLVSIIGNGSNLILNSDSMNDMVMNLYELWRDDYSSPRIRPFNDILLSFFSGYNNVCEFNAYSCNNIIGIDYQGIAYKCSRSFGLKHLSYGSIQDNSIEEILSSKDNQPIKRLNHLIDSNQSEYLDMHSGGCFFDNYTENNHEIGCTNNAKIWETIITKMSHDLKKNELRKKLVKKL